VTTETRDETSGYGNSLPFILLVCNSPEWWMDSGANIYVCVDVSLFSSYQVKRSGTLLMGNGSRAHVWCWYGHSKIYSEKENAIEELATCALHKEESC
jgi:hypothetical protein